MQSGWWQALLESIEQLQAARIDYTLISDTALYVHGVTLPPPQTIEVSIQWDLFERAYALLHGQEPIEQHNYYPIYRRFTVHIGAYTLALRCYPNTVVVTDPARQAVAIPVDVNGQNRKGSTKNILWVKSLTSYLNTRATDERQRQAVKAHLQQLQQQNNHYNEQAWNQDTYNAWLHRHGTPDEAGARVKGDPLTRLGGLNKYVVDYQGKRVINLMGSHGLKAIAMALLGAQVTIVDIAQENAHYASEVAQAAGVPIHYIVSDVLSLDASERTQSYDLVIMELGILHYFVDLEPLAQLIRDLLSPGGQFILQDFHPISTKLITSKGKKHRVDGNYFDPALITTDVAYSKHLPTQGIQGQAVETQQVYEREWTLGEIITAFAQAGLIIERLDEEPNMKIDDIGHPKTFTLIARQPSHVMYNEIV